MMKKTTHIILSLIILVLSIITFHSCKKEEELVKTECTPPNSPKAFNNGPLTTGDELILTAETIAEGTYSWTGPDGFSSTSQNPQLIFNKSKAGAYKVTVTVGNCTSNPYTTYVNSCETRASSNSPAIYTKKLHLKATSVYDAYGQTVPASFSWTGPNGFTSSKQNDSISNVQMEAAGMYIVTAVTNAGRINHDTTYVFIQPGPALFITCNKPAVGGTLNFTTETITGATYTWTGPNGFSSSVQNPSITNVTRQTNGIYTVIYTLNGIVSLPKTKYAHVKYSQSGCNGVDSITHNGRVYHTTEINGTQCWLKENLKRAPGVSGNPYYYKYVEAKPTVDTQGVCPMGWHLPTNADWQNLSLAVGHDGNTLKAIGQGTGLGAGTNTFGFSATLGIGGTAKYWSVTESPQSAIAMQLYSPNSYILTNLLNKTDSCFIRCIKD